MKSLWSSKVWMTLQDALTSNTLRSLSAPAVVTTGHPQVVFFVVAMHERAPIPLEELNLWRVTVCTGLLTLKSQTWSTPSCPPDRRSGFDIPQDDCSISAPTNEPSPRTRCEIHHSCLVTLEPPKLLT